MKRWISYLFEIILAVLVVIFLLSFLLHGQIGGRRGIQKSLGVLVEKVGDFPELAPSQALREHLSKERATLSLDSNYPCCQEYYVLQPHCMISQEGVSFYPVYENEGYHWRSADGIDKHYTLYVEDICNEQMESLLKRSDFAGLDQEDTSLVVNLEEGKQESRCMFFYPGVYEIRFRLVDPYGRKQNIAIKIPVKERTQV